MRLYSEKDEEQSIRAFGETPRSNRVDTPNALRSDLKVALKCLRSYS